MNQKKNLDVITPVRFFRGDKENRLFWMRKYPGRWENDSHFIRSACIHFIQELDRKYSADLFARKKKYDDDEFKINRKRVKK